MSNWGPRGANLANTRPTSVADPTGGTDTWCVDCSAAGVNDGTILDATFFNTIIGNLRYVQVTGGIAFNADDNTMLWQAIQAAIAGAYTAANGVVKTGTLFETTLGKGTEPVLAFGGINTVADTLLIYDVSGTTTSETTPYAMVKEVMQTEDE